MVILRTRERQLNSAHTVKHDGLHLSNKLHFYSEDVRQAFSPSSFLQHTETQGRGLYPVNDVSVYLGRQQVGGATN